MAAVLAGGRLLRRELLTDRTGAWREDLWLPAAAVGQNATSGPPAKPVLTAPLPINLCGTDSLTLLPGVGPVLASRIARSRADGLVFHDAADLQVVKGIGPVLASRLDSLLDYRLHGPGDGKPGPDPKSR